MTDKNSHADEAASLERQAEGLLGQKELSYKTLLEGLPDYVMRLDHQGRYLYASANISEVVDFPVADFIGKTYRELGFDEANCQSWDNVLQSVFDTGQPVETEFKLDCKKGVMIVNWRAIPERDDQGEVVSVLSICRDITAQRKIEQNYRMLFQEMLDGFALHEIICDDQGNPIDYRFLSVNSAFERMTGLKVKDIVGHTVLEVLPDTEKSWIEIFGKVALTGTPAFFENYSSELDKHFEVKAFRPAENQFACIFADVTDRKKAEESLHESEERFQQLFDHMADGVTVCHAVDDGQDFVFVDMNETGQSINKRKLEDIIGRRISEVLPGLEKIGLMDTLRRVWKTGEPELHPLTEYVDGCITRWVENYIYKLPSGLVVAIYSDRTEQKLIEADKAKLEHELNQVQKMDSVGRLAGGVAHDFNNMLGVILGHVDLAINQLDSSQPIFQDLEEIRKAAERSANLTRQLLAFARKQTVEPKVLDLNEIVENMSNMLRRLIGEDIDLDWKPKENLWPVKIDPSQIDQILANLCVNSRDAISGVGTMVIETENVVFDEAYCKEHAGFVPGEFVVLAVSDTGCGMDKEMLTSIFEPFFTTKGVGKGTGLGLATVYGIVKQNSGFINIYSEPGHGTTFNIYFPRYVGDDLTSRQDTQQKPAVSGHETVLLVEDEPAILNMIEVILENLGYTVISTDNPAYAIELAKEHKGEIQLLMTDVVMPDMNGRELSQHILSVYPKIKRLFMSGYTNNVVAHRGVLDEGVDFIQKPFSMQNLAAKIRTVMASDD